MQKSDSIAALAKALNLAQAALQPAVKDVKNDFFKSKYADLAAVWAAAGQPLADNGLAVTQLAKVPNFAETGPGVIIETILLHESGEWIAGEAFAPLDKQNAQGVGSATTYLRRYGLMAILGMVADDDDGNGASGHTSKPAPPAQPKANPAMQKALEKAMPTHTGPDPETHASETGDMFGTGAAKKLETKIMALCKGLNETGDSIKWSKKQLYDYVLEQFDEPLANIDARGVAVLIGDLTDRLNERGAIVGEPTSTPAPADELLTAAQLNTLQKLCGLKGLNETDVASQYSNDRSDKLADLSEAEAKAAIAGVQAVNK